MTDTPVVAFWLTLGVCLSLVRWVWLPEFVPGLHAQPPLSGSYYAGGTLLSALILVPAIAAVIHVTSGIMSQFSG